jgi:hypothetical protein
LKPRVRSMNALPQPLAAFDRSSSSIFRRTNRDIRARDQPQPTFLRVSALAQMAELVDALV